MSILDDFKDLCKEQDNSTELFLISIIEDSDNPRIIRDHSPILDNYTRNIQDKSEIFIFIDLGATYENNIIIGSINRGFKSINCDEFDFYNNLFLKKYIKNPARDFHKLPSYRILSMRYKYYNCTII